jgi:hypothetical protein
MACLPLLSTFVLHNSRYFARSCGMSKALEVIDHAFDILPLELIALSVGALKTAFEKSLISLDPARILQHMHVHIHIRTYYYRICLLSERN